MKKREKQRERGLDALRTIAFVFVVSVHFFLNNGFYSQKMEGFAMWGASCFRWLFFICVPLFLLITGYLRGEDRPGKAYYGGIFRILFSWLIISVISIGFQVRYDGAEKTLSQWVGDILNFKAANYSWYVEMYLGIFLLLPFINLSFHSIQSRKGHHILLISISALTFFPSMLCGLSIGEGVWNLLPDYWVALWPFAYYIIGCYIREYRPALPSLPCLITAAILCVLKGTVSYCTASGGTFSDGVGGGYSDIGVAAISVLVFLGIYRDSQKTKVPVWRMRKRKAAAGILEWISRLSFDAYLISWIFDRLLYGHFYGQITPEKYPFFYLIICVPVIILSLLAAWPISLISGKLSGLLKRCLKISQREESVTE